MVNALTAGLIIWAIISLIMGLSFLIMGLINFASRRMKG